jgi:hypothetical protein
MLLKIENSTEYEILSGGVNCGLNGLVYLHYAVFNNNLPLEKNKGKLLAILAVSGFFLCD